MLLLLTWFLVVILALDTTLSLTPRLNGRNVLNKLTSDLDLVPLGQTNDVSDRRRRDLLIGLGVWSNTVFVNTAQAFPNKISNQYDDRPKRRGPQVRNIGPKNWSLIGVLSLRKSSSSLLFFFIAPRFRCWKTHRYHG
jgi:hypothetical protein